MTALTQRCWPAAEAFCAAIGSARARPLEEICAEAGLDTPGQAASAKVEVRRRLQILLRDVVADAVDDPTEVEEELARVREKLWASSASPEL